MCTFELSILSNSLHCGGFEGGKKYITKRSVGNLHTTNSNAQTIKKKTQEGIRSRKILVLDFS